MELSKGELTLQASDREAKICAEIVGRSLGAYLKSVGLVSDTYLAQVLVALWDSGIYEYLRERGSLEIAAASRELNLDPEILRSLIEYLVGWEFLRPRAKLLSSAPRASLIGITSRAAC